MFYETFNGTLNTENWTFIEYFLQEVNKSTDNIMFIIADKAKTKKALSDLLQVPMVCCASHRLHLAVKNNVLKFEESLSKIH